MTWIPVKSSNLVAVSYEGDTLFVQFKSGIVYQYFGVETEVFDSLLEAESVGKFFNSEIKNGEYAYSIYNQGE